MVLIRLLSAFFWLTTRVPLTQYAVHPNSNPPTCWTWDKNRQESWFWFLALVLEPGSNSNGHTEWAEPHWCIDAVNRKCCSQARQEVLGCLKFDCEDESWPSWPLTSVCDRTPGLQSPAKPSLPQQANVQLRVKTSASPADRLSQSRSMVLQDPVLQKPVSTANHSVQTGAATPSLTS